MSTEAGEHTHGDQPCDPSEEAAIAQFEAERAATPAPPEPGGEAVLRRRLADMADMALGEVTTGAAYGLYHKSFREHFVARLDRAFAYMPIVAYLAPAPPEPDPEPQWEDCKVCGGDHWTKDHPATGKIVVLPDEPPLRSALEWARLALIQDVEPDAIIVHIEQALAATSSAGCPCPITFLNIEAACDECGHPLHGQPCPGAREGSAEK